MLYMVIDLSQQFYLFRACPAEKRIVDDKYIATSLVGEWFNLLDNCRG